MPRPLIGITTYQHLSDQGYPIYSASEGYTRSVFEGGGIPLLIPLVLDTHSAAELVNQLDGILFTGGGDIEPSLYGHEPHPSVAYVDQKRDAIEIELVHRAIDRQLPIFGICRGLQVINVALGGTLYEDILEQHPQAIQHQYYPDWKREHLSHSVNVSPNSRLASILGGNEFQVNSLHHQAVRRLAEGLQASAYAPDGILEALEITGYPYGIAVQWHPENLQHLPEMRALFSAFSQAATQFTEKGSVLAG